MYLKINALGDYKKKYDPFARLLALKRGVGVCSVVGVVSGFYGIPFVEVAAAEKPQLLQPMGISADRLHYLNKEVKHYLQSDLLIL